MAEEKRILIEKCDGTCCFSLPKKSEDDWPYGTLAHRPLGRYCYFEGGFGNCEKAKLVNEQICANCKHAKYRGLPYDTAIEKMARAMCSLEINCCECSYKNDENRCTEFLRIPTDCGYNYYELAEAALKTLLEN